MNNRNKRKELAEHTLQVLENGYYNLEDGTRVDIAEMLAHTVKHTVVYAPVTSDEILASRIPPSIEDSVKITVNGDTTLDATRTLIAAGCDKVLCLNFASAKNPGGGFLGGSQAQEESIARATGLYPSLLKAGEYYEVNRATKSCFYTDYMIYSPAVPIFKDEDGQLLSEPALTAVLTAPAVNTGVVQQRELERLAEVETVMKRRIAKVLAIAEKHGHRHLVLGAWGCGVFRNDPQQVARWFREVIDTDFSFAFEQIVFAIYAREERFIRPFQEQFDRKD